jgi:branched-chain amino acid transport system permease protein
MLKAGFIIPAALLAAGIAAAIFAAIISYPFFRLRGAYYAIATIGLVFFLYHLALNLEITGGVRGFSTVMPAETTSIPCYYLALGLALSTVFISYKLGNSRFGLALISIREDEDTAQVFGVNSLKYKILTLILSAFFAGLVGGVYTWYIGYINPNTIFGLGITLLPVTMAFLGGSGHFLGPVIRAVFMTTVRELIWTQVAYFHLATYGLVLILVGLFIPGGIIRSERFIRLVNRVLPVKGSKSLKKLC